MIHTVYLCDECGAVGHTQVSAYPLLRVLGGRLMAIGPGLVRAGWYLAGAIGGLLLCPECRGTTDGRAAIAKHVADSALLAEAR